MTRPLGSRAARLLAVGGALLAQQLMQPGPVLACSSGARHVSVSDPRWPPKMHLSRDINETYLVNGSKEPLVLRDAATGRTVAERPGAGRVLIPEEWWPPGGQGMVGLVVNIARGKARWTLTLESRIVRDNAACDTELQERQAEQEQVKLAAVQRSADILAGLERSRAEHFLRLQRDLALGAVLALVTAARVLSVARARRKNRSQQGDPTEGKDRG